MKSVIQSKGLDRKYGCKVFSMKKDEVTAFVKHIESELKTAQAANTSLFSILCVMKAPRPTYDVTFLRRLSLAHNKFHRTGKYANNEEIYTSIYLTFPSTEKVELPEAGVISQHGPDAINADQLAEMIIFFDNFKRIENCAGKLVQELIDELPPHMRGQATAVIQDDSNFDMDLQEHDSYLFYDIEEAIDEGLDFTKRYKVQINYPNK